MATEQEKTPKTNWVKAYIIDVLPLMTLAIFALAIYYNYSYYSVFDFNIIPYLSWSELLLSIAVPLLAFFMNFFVFSVLLYGGNYLCSIDKSSVFDIRNTEMAKSFIKLMKLKPYFPILLDIFCASLLFIISRKLFPISDDMSLSKATSALIIPFILLLMVLLFFNLLFPFDNIKYVKNLSVGRKAIYFVVFYWYALTFFGESGHKNGLYYKNHNVSFEIKTEDNSVFNDSLYIYFGQTKDNFFIQEKQSNKNVILNTNTIVYSKIERKEQGGLLY